MKSILIMIDKYGIENTHAKNAVNQLQQTRYSHRLLQRGSTRHSIGDCQNYFFRKTANHPGRKDIKIAQICSQKILYSKSEKVVKKRTFVAIGNLLQFCFANLAQCQDLIIPDGLGKDVNFWGIRSFSNFLALVCSLRK